jgi:membrane-associated protease RseP (regulator of RpoE activity)
MTEAHRDAEADAGTPASSAPAGDGPESASDPRPNGSSGRDTTANGDGSSVAVEAAPDRPSPPVPPYPGRDHDGPVEPESYKTGGLRLALLVGGLAAIGVFHGWAWVAIIFGIVVMIFLHELGHYATAKWSGMKVTEFFIGFGPRIWSFQRGETEYGIKVIPAGAYVRIIGMNNLDETDPADEPRTYRKQSFPKRLLVVSAGSIMHMVQAFVILVILLSVTGVPGGSITQTDDVTATAWDVDAVSPDSGAEEAGLRDGDRIVAVDGEPAASFDNLSVALASFDVGDEVALTVERDGEATTLTPVLGPRPAGIGGEVGSPFVGVTTRSHFSNETVGLGQAVIQAPGEMLTITGDAIGAITGFFSPDGLSDFAGNFGGGGPDGSEPAPSGSGGSPEVSSDDGSENRIISIYGAARIGTQLSEQGWAPVLLLFFSINIFIGLLNMAPLPPLDGGHAAVAIYERVRSRRGKRYHVDMAKLMPLTYAVLLVLITIGGAALWLDIVNPIDI